MLPSLNGVSASCIVLPVGAWQTLYQFLIARFPQVSTHEWRARFERGEIRNAKNEPLPLQTPYQAHQKIYYYRHLANEEIIPFKEQILFQDELILVADKPHFLPVVPSGRYVRETLLTRLKQQLGSDTITPMHRIDKDTAGLVLFTLQPGLRDAYQRLFREKKVEKCYHAIAGINPSLKLPMLYRSRLQESPRYMQMEETQGEINAETVIELAELKGEKGLYHLRPSTGQKHQLRAHMAALGIPILNDRFYPILLPQSPQDNHFDKPLQLLAKSVSFIDPITGQQRIFESAQSLKLS
ncbi:MAG TPA: pseudouridine synthase [Pseudomonadales bacterium]|nr:pseudouridine synthase [Pseudomonadales bacterium]